MKDLSCICCKFSSEVTKLCINLYELCIILTAFQKCINFIQWVAYLEKCKEALNSKLQSHHVHALLVCMSCTRAPAALPQKWTPDGTRMIGSLVDQKVEVMMTKRKNLYLFFFFLSETEVLHFRFTFSCFINLPIFNSYLILAQ